MGSIFRILSITALVLSLGLAFAGPAAAIPELADCPGGKKEVYVLPFARANDAVCETLVQCLNLDKKDASTTVQFFFQVGVQAGSDATSIVPPGETDLFVTGVDPSGQVYLGLGLNNAVTDDFIGFGRVCSDRNKLACDAFLICTVSKTSLRLIKKQQKGD